MTDPMNFSPQNAAKENESLFYDDHSRGLATVGDGTTT